jgi:mannitol-1-/sugar-/sorbitol-6-/2-deoxyglucose-6-phosphatase
MSLRAAIYDMDGLVVDSEPSWIAAEVEVFRSLGVPMTPTLCRETTGMRLDEAVAHWSGRFPWEGPSQAEILQRLLGRATELIVARAVAKRGVLESLEVMRGAGLRCALASSSPMALIEAVMQKLKLMAEFELMVSAESEPFGKPHPAIYLRAAERLGVDPQECLALEDSLNGVVAAKAARMKCIAVPENWRDPRLALADAVVESLLAVDAALLARLDAG